MERNDTAYAEFKDARDAQIATIEQLYKEFQSPMKVISRSLHSPQTIGHEHAAASPHANDFDPVANDAKAHKEFEQLQSFLHHQALTFRSAMERYREATPETALYDLAMITRDLDALRIHALPVVERLLSDPCQPSHIAAEADVVLDTLNHMQRTVTHAEEEIDALADSISPSVHPHRQTVNEIRTPLIQHTNDGTKLLTDICATLGYIRQANPDAEIASLDKACAQANQALKEYAGAHEQMHMTLAGLRASTTPEMIQHHSAQLQTTLRSMRDRLKDGIQQVVAIRKMGMEEFGLQIPKEAIWLEEDIHENAPRILGRLSQINEFKLRSLAPESYEPFNKPSARSR